MWSVVPNEIKSSIFYYKTGSFEEIKHDRSDTCEDVCKELCRRWKLPPLIQLLFGLRIHGKKLWLAGCRQLKDGEKYEFRIRFKIPKFSDLITLDKKTYDYFYHQVRYDVLHNAIPEIAYPNYKNVILGLCVTDMYVEMIENNKSVDYLKKNYKMYIPKELAKHHSVFAKREIESSLKNIQNKDYDAFYVKGIYLQQIDAKAPNYLTEEYSGTTPCPKEDGLKQGTCNVKMQIAPFHQDEPGLRIYYAHKNSWKHVSKFADFYTIQIDDTMNQVSLEIQNSPLGFPITMDSTREIESFVSCIAGYYRLMVKWSMDLCSQLASPSLKFLTDRKIHGPIGGTYSYSKIEEKSSSIGSFVVRQCEKVFDTFYIDIVTKENQPETFKILYNLTASGDQWRLCLDDTETLSEFDDLITLAKSIEIGGLAGGRYFRLPPTQHDRSPLLLLCQPPTKHLTKETGSLRSANPLLFRAVDDLMLYKWRERKCADGVFRCMKAELKQPNGKKVEVTLKILESTEVELRLTDFVKLADKWAKLDLSEIVRMHGITLHQPISLVMESIKVGPLDDFLRNPRHKKDVKLLDLVEISYTLAKALHYLQENQIVHGRIRCSTLQVMQFTPNSQLVVKLGDPGLPLDITTQDIPWIPIEDYDDLSQSRNNLKGDIWAYATTLWEIFSRGAQLNLQNPVQFFRDRERPPKPADCAMLPGIHDLMIKGWDEDPDKRFSPQKIFSRLLEAKTALSRNYSEPNNGTTTTNISNHTNGGNGIIMNGTMHSRRSRTTTVSDYYSGSMLSADTQHTYITSPATTQAYIENCGSSIASNQSNDGGSSQVSLLNGSSSNGSQTTIPFCGVDDLKDVPSVLEYKDSNLIFQGQIGSGNYGCVYRGTIQRPDYEQPVAIKMLQSMESNTMFKDFQREYSIMDKLEHPNIVKIHGFMEQPPLIIMEFIRCGSLLTYLSIHRPDLKIENLLNFAANIADGMNYLERQRIVHRDLAARNVLVANENCVKIADFGLAQFTTDGYYYHSTNCRALPIKWYAPETIGAQKFSHKSDVWSFGVTLYEMFTFGDSPNLKKNPDLDQNEILRLLDSGERLECPRFCPPAVYDELMFICWNHNPKLRPTFAELLRRTIELINANGESV